MTVTKVSVEPPPVQPPPVVQPPPQIIPQPPQPPPDNTHALNLANDTATAVAGNHTSGNLFANNSNSSSLVVTGVIADAASDDTFTVDGTYGTLVVHTDGSYTYTLGETSPERTALNGLHGQLANDDFTYTVSDGSGGTGTAELTVSVASPQITRIAVPRDQSDGEHPVAFNAIGPSISADGRHVVFIGSDALPTPGTGDQHGSDVYLYDRITKHYTALTDFGAHPRRTDRSKLQRPAVDQRRRALCGVPGRTYGYGRRAPPARKSIRGDERCRREHVGQRRRHGQWHIGVGVECIGRFELTRSYSTTPEQRSSLRSTSRTPELVCPHTWRHLLPTSSSSPGVP